MTSILKTIWKILVPWGIGLAALIIYADGFLTDLWNFFWPWGVVWAVIGAIGADLAGYTFHRYFLHGLVLRGKKYREGGGRLAFLYVPWMVAWEKHMWHHYFMYPDPDAPGIKAGPFRPRREYYNGLETAKHRFGSVPSEHPRFDYVEWILSKLGLPVSLDWAIASAIFAFLVYAVMHVFLAAAALPFVFFFIGGALAGIANEISHKSFHILPYPRLRDVPWKYWFRPGIALANLGEHLPVFRRIYRFLFLRHLAHHYVAIPADDGNHEYRGVVPNGNTTMFTMFTLWADILFGTYCGRDFEEIVAEEGDTTTE